jgi:hypothetical protein
MPGGCFKPYLAGRCSCICELVQRPELAVVVGLQQHLHQLLQLQLASIDTTEFRRAAACCIRLGAGAFERAMLSR